MKIGRGELFWDEDTKTFSYLSPQLKKNVNVDALIAQHQKSVEVDPEDAGTRSMLEACLQANGQVEEAIIEWRRVATSQEDHWNKLAKKALLNLTST